MQARASLGGYATNGAVTKPRVDSNTPGSAEIIADDITIGDVTFPVNYRWIVAKATGPKLSPLAWRRVWHRLSRRETRRSSSVARRTTRRRPTLRITATVAIS